LRLGSDCFEVGLYEVLILGQEKERHGSKVMHGNIPLRSLELVLVINTGFTFLNTEDARLTISEFVCYCMIQINPN